MEMVGTYMKDMESFLMMYFIVDQCYWKEPEDPMAIFLGEISPYLLIDGRPFDTSVYKKWKEQGGVVVVTGCSAQMRNILNMAGVFSLIEYMDTKKEALEYLHRREVS